MMKPIFTFERSSIPELKISGIAEFLTKGSSPQEGQALLPARSLLKPWQFAFNLPALPQAIPSYAIAIGSQNGEALHVEALEKFSKHVGQVESDLLCPACYPMHNKTSWSLKLSNADKRKFFHPCAGKHFAFLANARKKGLSKLYTDKTHILQGELYKWISDLADETPPVVNDGCTLPTFALSLSAHIKLWQKMACCEDKVWLEVKSLWTENAHLVGGTDRLDTGLIEAGKGLIVAKEGADGLLAVQSLGPDKSTAFIKIWNGYQPDHLELALLSLLKTQKNLPSAFGPVLDWLSQRVKKLVPRDQEFKINL